jgi:hypothetical protein
MLGDWTVAAAILDERERERSASQYWDLLSILQDSRFLGRHMNYSQILYDFLMLRVLGLFVDGNHAFLRWIGRNSTLENHKEFIA